MIEIGDLVKMKAGPYAGAMGRVTGRCPRSPRVKIKIHNGQSRTCQIRNLAVVSPRLVVDRVDKTPSLAKRPRKVEINRDPLSEVGWFVQMFECAWRGLNGKYDDSKFMEYISMFSTATENLKRLRAWDAAWAIFHARNPLPRSRSVVARPNS